MTPCTLQYMDAELWTRVTSAQEAKTALCLKLRHVEVQLN